MKFEKLLLILLGFALFTISSCGGDDDDDGGNTNGFSCSNLETFYETSFNNYFTAFESYINTPNTTTCNAYVDALEQYIDDLANIIDCPGVTNGAELQTALSDAEDAIDEARTSCASL